MQTNPILLDVTSADKDCITSLKLVEGQLLTAKVARIKGEMVLLVLNSRIPLQSRLCCSLNLAEGQKLKLKVKEAGPNKLVFEVINEAQTHYRNLKSLLKQIGIGASETNCRIAKAIMGEGLPVTEENINFVSSTLKSIRYILDNIQQLEEVRLPEGTDIVKAPVGDIARWMTDNVKEKGKSIDPIHIEKMGVIAKALKDISCNEVARLLRLGIKPTPSNLEMMVISKQNRGFLKDLIKLIWDNHETVTASKELNTMEDGKSKYVPQINRIKVGELVKKVSKNFKQGTPDVKPRAVLELLVQRASVLDKALKGADCHIVPFTVDGNLQEAIIMVEEGKRHKKEQPGDEIQFFISTQTRHIGKIGVAVAIKGSVIGCKFMLEGEGISRFIEQEKDLLCELLNEIGYGLLYLTCTISKRGRNSEKIKFFDMRV